MIGIYGGTFDPIHYGHLRSALEVKEIFALYSIRLIPCYQQPHKNKKPTILPIRLKMLELAINNHSGLDIDRRELHNHDNSYMLETLKSIRFELPNVSLLLFIGLDVFNNLSSWYKWQRLFDYAHIVIMTRPGYTQQKLSAFFASKLIKTPKKLKEKLAGCLFFQTVTMLDISATAIRNIIKTGLNPQFLLPDNVIEYINQNQLYKN